MNTQRMTEAEIARHQEDISYNVATLKRFKAMGEARRAVEVTPTPASPRHVGSPIVVCPSCYSRVINGQCQLCDYVACTQCGERPRQIVGLCRGCYATAATGG